MAKEICISSTPHETRLAILEDDQLAEIYYERENEYTLAGSVYKGRVTRVLPGMQSAFVDIGLERDAFLYVTDFLEMEDPEDTDEVERAASQGDTQRPQQSQALGNAAQGQAPVAGQGRSGRGERGRRGEGRPAATEVESRGQLQTSPTLSVTPITASTTSYGGDIPAEAASGEGVSSRREDGDEQGTRRWRGRRRRRGGRGREIAGQEPASDGSTGSDEVEETEVSSLDFEAAASQPVSRPTPAAYAVNSQSETVPDVRPATPVPFLLPGESLSKYGTAPTAPTPSRLILTQLPTDTSDPLPERTVTKPSTLIEDEIIWDGKGLLPGESIARHRAAEARPSVTVDAEPTGVFANGVEAEIGKSSYEPIVFEFSEETFESAPHHAAAEVEEARVAETDVHTIDAPVESDLQQGTDESSEGHSEKDTESVGHSWEDSRPEAAEHATVEGIHHADEPEVAAVHVEQDAEEPEITPEEGEIHKASASHNFDPLPPSGFRFKDLFGNRRKEEEQERPAESPEPKTVPTVSAYSPGPGVVEEEIIEEEEYEFTPLKAHHGDDHDLEELEEETIQQQIRSGALGEMLQEAHLDHRIQLESEDEDESDTDEDEDAEGVSVSNGGQRQPATGPGSSGGGRSGDRGGRGRRGRNGGSGAGDGRRGGPGMSRRSAQTSDLPIISDLLKPGQEILVQIAKEPIAKKGARITSHIALPGRFLVFMPTVSHVGVSRKIASDEERQRLKRILISEKGDAQGGFIVRTAAEGTTEEELRADLRFLITLWNDIKQRADSSKPPALIYHDLSLIERILRDQVSDNFSHIWVDSEADYERIVRFLNRFSPELVRRVKLYTKEIPLFEHFGIQDEISKALRSKVWLKSGGSIVINQTEALVAIDINTGKFVGKTARLEDTILKTNLDAIPEIVRQIRLRDLGGIIVIDFIDMDERKNRTRVMAALEEALKQDRAPTKVLQFNDFGLVAITRKRVKQSLERTLSVPCPICQATGMVKSPATVANEIYIEMRKMRKHFDQPEVLLRVNPETVKVLKLNNARWLTELEDLTGKNVLVKSDATLHPEQFDIQG